MSGRRRVKSIAYDEDDYWEGDSDDFQGEEEEEEEEDEEPGECISSSYMRSGGTAGQTTSAKKRGTAGGKATGYAAASATRSARAQSGQKVVTSPPKKKDFVSGPGTTSTPTTSTSSSARVKPVASQAVTHIAASAVLQKNSPASSSGDKASCFGGRGQLFPSELEGSIKRESHHDADGSSGENGTQKSRGNICVQRRSEDDEARQSPEKSGGEGSPKLTCSVSRSGTRSLSGASSGEKCDAGHSGSHSEENAAKDEEHDNVDKKDTRSRISATRSVHNESKEMPPVTDRGGGGNCGDEKPQEDICPFSIIVIGHVDAGKSTLTGQLLFRTGAVAEREVEKMKRMSTSAGKGSFFYAWLCDEGEDERQRGVTIDVSCRVIVTAKNRRRISFLDAPGHHELVSNMLGGAVLADAALLVVDAGQFEAGFEGQTKEHLLIARSLNIQHFVVAVNKMDAVDWSEKTYNDIVERLRSFLTGPEIACPVQQIYFVPVSALVGVNLVSDDTSEQLRLRAGPERRPSSGAYEQKKRESLWNVEQLETHTKLLRSWWRGPSMLDLLENIQINTLASQRQLTSESFTACVADMWSLSSSSEEFNFSFKVASGALRVGDKVAALPANVVLICKALSTYGEATKSCASGDFVEKGSFSYAHSAPPMDKDMPSAGIEAVGVGTVLCSSTRLLRVVSTFLCKIIVFSRDLPLMPGRQLVAYIHTMTCQCIVRRVVATINRKTGAVVEQKQARRCALVFGMAGIVEVDISPGKVCVREKKTTDEQTSVLSRIILRDPAGTAAAGVVVEDVGV